MPTTQSAHVDQSNLATIHAAWDEYEATDVAPDESEADYLAWLAAEMDAEYEAEMWDALIGS